jgi:hypothetical protein
VITELQNKAVQSPIQLRELHVGSPAPFEAYPQLLDIWPQAYTEAMVEAVTEDLARIGMDVGGIFLIEKAGAVIGITGYYYYDENDPCAVGLRWHGLISSERGKGYSEVALLRMLKALRAKRSYAGTLLELVPLTEYGRPLAKHFSALGFKAKGEPEAYDWAENDWQPYYLEIGEFLENRS